MNACAQLQTESNGKYYGNGYSESMEQNSASVLQIPDEDKKCDQFKRQERQKWEMYAIILAIVSVVSLVVLGSISFYVSSKTSSAAAYGFGFDCFLDVGTSLVVIWRFCGANNSQSNRKENIALVTLGILFIVAAISVAVKAITYLTDGTLMHTSIGLYCLSGSATVISTSLFIMKYYVAYKLDSKSIRADGYSSLACGVTALTIIISSIAFTINEDVYYLDDVVGIVLAVVLLLYGIKMIIDVWCKSSEVNTHAQTKLTVVGQRGYETME